MIDWTRVSELQDEIGADDFAEVVEIFLEEVEEEIAALQSGVAEEELQGKLHFLKGSALNLGFTDFAALCAEGERAAAQQDFEQINIPNIIECYGSSKTELLNVFQERAEA